MESVCVITGLVQILGRLNVNTELMLLGDCIMHVHCTVYCTCIVNCTCTLYTAYLYELELQTVQCTDDA